MIYRNNFIKVPSFASQDMLTKLLRNCLSQSTKAQFSALLIFCRNEMEAETLKSSHTYFKDILRRSHSSFRCDSVITVDFITNIGDNCVLATTLK